MSQQLENAIFELIIEFMGGEANLRKRVADFRGSLHGSFDSMRSATVSGVTNLPERFRRSSEERAAQPKNNLLANNNTPQQDKFQQLLRTIDPDMKEQERRYLSSKSDEMSKSIAESIAKGKDGELKNIATDTYKQEIAKHREMYNLLNEYKNGGDRALTKACNMEPAKKQHFYQSIPEGNKLYERIKQARFEGKDSSLLEKEIQTLVLKALNGTERNVNSQTTTYNQSRNSTDDISIKR